MVDRSTVIQRLKMFGYSVEPNYSLEDDSDEIIIDFELQKTLNYVMNYCNLPTISNIPSILDPRIVDRVCCDFLYQKKNLGKLPGFNYDVVIKSIKEGDTQIQYAVGQGEDTPENRFDAFVKSLERGFDKWITPHRRLRW